MDQYVMFVEFQLGQKSHISARFMPGPPRIGETVVHGGQLYDVTDISWEIDPPHCPEVPTCTVLLKKATATGRGK